MTERLSGQPKQETYAAVVRPALLAELQFVDGTSYLWTGVGPLAWGGHTWLGLGSLGTVSPVEETTDLKAVGAKFQLSGVDPTLLATVMGEPIQGRPALLYLAFFDPDWQLIPDPVLLFRGRMDTVEIPVGGDSATIALNVENRLRDLERVRVRRYTDADQQAEYPGDQGFAFVTALQDAQIIWGRAP